MGRVTVAQFEQLSVAERHELLTLRLRRRGLLRAAGVAGAAVTGLGAGPALLARAASSTGAVLGVWLAFGTDPQRQVTVSWQTSTTVANPVVRYGRDAAYGSTVRADATPLHTVLGTGSSFDQHYLHATLDGLAPGTTYHYRVEHDGFTGTDASFTTAPASPAAGPGGVAGSPFTFTAVGDQGTDGSAAELDALIGRQQPRFHVVAGDLSYADSTGTGMATDRFDPTLWDTYLTQIGPTASRVPWMVVAGNHELEAVYGDHGMGGFTKRFVMPANGPPGCPATYVVRYGNVAVVSLDANDVSNELTANRGYSGGRQTAWADATLATLRADAGVDFVVVVFHHCAYATGVAHGSDGGVRAAWVPLFDRYRVDLVINGHNHCYERSDPLRAGLVRAAAPTGATVRAVTDGTVYVVAGGGGRDLTSFNQPAAAGSDAGSVRTEVWQAPGRATAEQASWSRVRHARFTLLALDVTPAAPGGRSTMRLRAVGLDGGVLDTLTFTRDRPVAAGAATAVATAAGSAGSAASAGTSRPAGPAGSAGHPVWRDAGLAVAVAAAAGGVALSRRARTAHPKPRPPDSSGQA